MEAIGLLPEEVFALSKAVESQATLAAFVKRLLGQATVIRKRSDVGFFATVTFPEALPDTEQNQWDWNFRHSDMPNGGSFICWREEPNALGLEAVSFVDSWPKQFEADRFEEA